MYDGKFEMAVSTLASAQLYIMLVAHRLDFAATCATTYMYM
jgi:hypothetical protein